MAATDKKKFVLRMVDYATCGQDHITVVKGEGKLLVQFLLRVWTHFEANVPDPDLVVEKEGCDCFASGMAQTPKQWTLSIDGVEESNPLHWFKAVGW